MPRQGRERTRIVRYQDRITNLSSASTDSTQGNRPGPPATATGTTRPCPAPADASILCGEGERSGRDRASWGMSLR